MKRKNPDNYIRYLEREFLQNQEIYLGIKLLKEYIRISDSNSAEELFETLKYTYEASPVKDLDIEENLIRLNFLLGKTSVDLCGTRNPRGNYKYSKLLLWDIMRGYKIRTSQITINEISYQLTKKNKLSYLSSSATPNVTVIEPIIFLFHRHQNFSWDDSFLRVVWVCKNKAETETPEFVFEDEPSTPNYSGPVVFANVQIGPDVSASTKRVQLIRGIDEAINLTIKIANMAMLDEENS